MRQLLALTAMLFCWAGVALAQPPGAPPRLEAAAEAVADNTAQAPTDADAAADATTVEAMAAELARLRQMAGRTERLDTENVRLLQEAANLRHDIETLRAENQRLQDSLRSEDFINGALAVLLGVIITLLVPRLVPKKRRYSEWA